MDRKELNSVFEDYLGHNRGPGYGVSVTGISDDLSEVKVTVTFLAGKTYCCAEAHCHLPLNLSRFRQFAAERGVVFPRELQIRWHIIVEEGVQNASCRNMQRDTTVSTRYEYDAVSPLPERV